MRVVIDTYNCPSSVPNLIMHSLILGLESSSLAKLDGLRDYFQARFVTSPFIPWAAYPPAMEIWRQQTSNASLVNQYGPAIYSGRICLCR